MTWSDTPIDGQQSVAANKSPINTAFTYIANEMKKDHFWDNANANLDGRHQFVQMPKLEDAGNPDNPTIATDMDGVYYLKDKTATESPDLQIPEPFYYNHDGTQNQILQLGARVMLTFRIAAGAIVQNGGNDWDYQHNVATVVRTAEGKYTITFTTPLPTAGYIVSSSLSLTSIVTASRDSGMIIRTKAVGSVEITASNSGGNFDPDAIDLIIFGG